MGYSKKYKPCFVTLFVGKRKVGCCYVPEGSTRPQRVLEARKKGIVFYDGIRFERGDKNHRNIVWNTDFPNHKNHFLKSKTNSISKRR